MANLAWSLEWLGCLPLIETHYQKKLYDPPNKVTKHSNNGNCRVNSYRNKTNKDKYKNVSNDFFRKRYRDKFPEVQERTEIEWINYLELVRQVNTQLHQRIPVRITLRQDFFSSSVKNHRKSIPPVNTANLTYIKPSSVFQNNGSDCTLAPSSCDCWWTTVSNKILFCSQNYDY
jgi:hypothetical protein